MNKISQILVIGIFALLSGNVYASPTEKNYAEKGFLLAESGKYKEALKAFEKAIELDPKNWFILGDKAKMEKLIKDASK